MDAHNSDNNLTDNADINAIYHQLKQVTQDQPYFHQAVSELLSDIAPLVAADDSYNLDIIKRMLHPDRIVQFSVPWYDDNDCLQINTGWRVQFNNAMGPYKGGLRFHPNVSVDTFKFLAFEQTFKNALTHLPMGGAKGGSDFNPKGKSNAETRRFCQSFMLELSRYIGAQTDIPAGDIGVGAREVGYLFGYFNRLVPQFETGVLTGKSPDWGGSLLRKEATGYGVVYFLLEVLNAQNKRLEGSRCAISGSGNVALYTAKKLMELGGLVVSLSDSNGTLESNAGLTHDQLNSLITLKEINRGRLRDFADTVRDVSGLSYHEASEPWGIAHDIALPCATQNEIDEADAQTIIASGCKVVAEGANMPCTLQATHAMMQAGITVLPSKAANAGGVSVSGLERSQNMMGLSWSATRVDEELKEIMKNIHDASLSAAKAYGSDDKIDYVKGANIAGFKRIYTAMAAYYG